MSIKRILGVLSLILLSAPVMPGLPATLASAGTPDARSAGVRAAAAEDPMVTQTRKTVELFIQRWNENKLEEMVADHYVEDAVVLPPNHEPIRGHQAILAYWKSLRDVAGEFDKGDYLIRATPSGIGAVSWVGQYNFHDGKLRAVSHELYVRQSDGSMRNAVDMVGYRDPMA